MDYLAFIILFFNHKSAAFRALFRDRFVPADKITFRISFTAIKFSVFTACFFQKTFAAFRAGRTDIFQYWHSVPAIGKIGTG